MLLAIPAVGLLALAVPVAADGAPTVTVRSGDTLAEIAGRHGVSASALARHNDIRNRAHIRIGQVLKIPRPWTRYRVRPGESLGAIARRHGTSTAALTRRNRIKDPSLVHAGQTILVPVKRAERAAPAGASPAVTGRRIPTGWTRYRVRPGESLGQIAVNRGTTSARIARVNGIGNPSAIQAGRIIRVPRKAATRATPARRAWVRYRIRAGESLGVIAARRGTSSAALARRNGIDNPSLIRVGQVIRVPRGTPGPLGRADGGLPSLSVTAHPRVAQAAGRSDVVRLINATSRRYGVDPRLARAISWQESGYQQSVVSSTGAVGVMQLMPGTAKWLAQDVVGRPLNPRSLADNVEGGVAYLAWLTRRTSRRHAIAGYYQGLRSISERGLYRDTRRYVANVEALIRRT